MTFAENTKIVADAACALGEHFDVVQILVSSSEGDDTFVCKQGTGNFYARLGLAREFVEEDRAVILASKIAYELNCGEDE